MQHADLEKNSLPSRRVVLLGIGHTNAHVLNQWRKSPLPNTELVCISDHTIATYSGLLPAVLAGQLPPSAMEIDLPRLCQAANARLLVNQVSSIDPVEKVISFLDRPALSFDVLSIGIGSVPRDGSIGVNDANVVTIKPMQTFLERVADGLKKSDLQSDQQADSSSLSIVIVGGGAAGVEIACCLPHFLQQQASQQSYQITIVNRGENLLNGSSPKVQAKVESLLRSKRVELLKNQAVVKVTGRVARLNNANELTADLVIWATGAAPPPLLRKLEFPIDDRGFLLTDDTLRLISGEPVFAVGDSGTIKGENIPKAGVFAVRQGPILWENIQRLFTGRKLKKYQPQRNFLRLLNTGDGKAFAEWFGYGFYSSLMKRWKDHIDLKFVKKYQIAQRR